MAAVNTISSDNNDWVDELDMFRSLIDQSHDMVFFIRIDNAYIEYVNQTTKTMLGYSLEEMRSIGVEGFRRPLKENELFSDSTTVSLELSRDG
jgi:PAS domain S-box-containing protein